MNTSEKNIAQEMKRSLFFITVSIIFGKIFFITVNGAPSAGFLRALGANDLLYSIIAAMPYIAGVFQIFASYLLEKTGRRKLIFLITGYVRSIIWIPIVLTPLLMRDQPKSTMLMIITFLFFIYAVASSSVNISYLSWMGSIIPENIKGSFFGRRTAISTVTGIIASVIVGWYLDELHSMLSFAVVFIGISICSLMDTSCYLGVIDPPMEVNRENRPSFMTMLKEPFKEKNYLKLIIFVSCWNFSINLATPFFNIYMIEQLKMSYLSISIFTQFVAGITTVIFINKIGVLSDKYGIKPVIRICCIFEALLPITWCLADKSNYFVVLSVSFLISGLFHQGSNMLISNFSIWLAPEKNRSMFLANYSLITTLFSGLAYICAGAFMESSKGFIRQLNNWLFGFQLLSNFHVLFIISAVIMVFTLIFILPMVYDKDEKNFCLFRKSRNLNA